MANGDAGDIYASALNSAQRKVREMIYKYRTKGFIGGKNIAVCRNEARLINYAKAKGIEIASRHLYMGPKSISHALRPSKSNKGLAIEDSALISFITTRNKMDLYWDGECFVYTDYVNKFILHPNYEIKVNRKRSRKVCFITATTVEDSREFRYLRKYKKI